MSPRRGQEHRLRVDPTACTAHGLCAVLLAERIRLDEWGYPVVDGASVEHDLLQHARQAASDCPTRALRLTTTPRRS